MNVLRHNDFLDGATDTAFFDNRLAEFTRPLADDRAVRLSRGGGGPGRGRSQPGDGHRAGGDSQRLAQSRVG